MEIVNGYACRNCADMDLAKRGVDPARPNDGPNGVYRADRVEAAKQAQAEARAGDRPPDRGPAVTFKGGFADISLTERPDQKPYIPGTVADLKA